MSINQGTGCETRSKICLWAEKLQPIENRFHYWIERWSTISYKALRKRCCPTITARILLNQYGIFKKLSSSPSRLDSFMGFSRPELPQVSQVSCTDWWFTPWSTIPRPWRPVGPVISHRSWSSSSSDLLTVTCLLVPKEMRETRQFWTEKIGVHQKSIKINGFWMTPKKKKRTVWSYGEVLWFEQPLSNLNQQFMNIKPAYFMRVYGYGVAIAAIQTVHN